MRFITVSFFCLILTTATYGQRFNEICPSNVSAYEVVNDDIVYFPDWVELYNNTSDAIDLTGYSITDDSNFPEKWTFSGETLPSDGYLVLGFDEKKEVAEFIDFELGRKGGALFLYDASGVLVDSITRPSLEPDHSYGKINEKWYYFETPTPGEENANETGFKGYSNQPQVNRESGRQSKGTNVVIRPKEENEKIFYSLNGIDPLDAYEYTEPIVLEKTTSLRIVAKQDSMIESSAIYRSYFVDITHHLPVVHLHLDSLELLDDTVGIYVFGPDASDEYPYFGANFWKDIEIHAYYEFFDKDYGLQEALDCGIKIHGGTVSSTRPMKSLRLIAHNRNEQEEFLHPYFSNKENYGFKRLLLRNSGSDFNRTHLKDGVLHQFILDHDIDVDAQGYEPVVVYINGLYWGIHNLREKLDKHFVASNYGVPADSVNLLEEEELFLISGDSMTFITLRDYALANNLNEEVHWNWVNERLDTKSMVDYFIMELFMNNRDWPYNNLKLWNSASLPRWRYFYSDLDAGIKYYGENKEDLQSLAYILGPYGDNNVHVNLFEKLLENEEFERYFINRYADLMNTILTKNYIVPYVYSAKKKLDPEMGLHFFKWWGYMDEWNEHFLEYDRFFDDRVEIVQEELSEVFDKVMPIDVYIGLYPAQSATIKLNTIELDSFPFLGKYYPDNRIDLSVNPTGTAHFKYWENLRTGERYESPSIQIDPTTNDSLIAVFDTANDFNLSLYPVPVNQSSNFSFSLSESGSVDILIASIDGKQMGGKSFSYLAKGSYLETYDFSGLANGIYLLTIRTTYGLTEIVSRLGDLWLIHPPASDTRSDGWISDYRFIEVRPLAFRS